jgi:hypothetical protein
MNERIEELAEQAELEYNFDPMTWLKYEKFAELIVRECADIANGLAVPTVALRIKEHFGIQQ